MWRRFCPATFSYVISSSLFLLIKNSYIHCVKLKDTGAPYPLLSEAARSWRGPRPALPSVASASDHSVLQTAGQTTSVRDIPPAPQRQPLPLKPRTVSPFNDQGMPSSSTSATALSGVQTRLMTDSGAINSRAESFDRERPKLQLQKRSVPAELPPFQPPQNAFNLSEQMERSKQRMAEKARKEQEEMARKQRALELAFASDDEEEEVCGGCRYDSDEWEEQEAEYSGSSDEE